MAERKAVNKYYPPDWDPSKGSLNRYHRSHPLRDRAKRLDEGVLIVRFEMPYNIWCTSCNNHIGQGVRYNSEKKQIGMYFSTPIYSFRMKCHRCDGWIEMRTDPKNAEYIVFAGGKRKNEIWEASSSELEEFKDAREADLLANNAFFRVEYQAKDEQKAKKSIPALISLQEHNKRWKDDYAASQLMRKRLREGKKVDKLKEQDLLKRGIGIKLLEEDPKDIEKAKSLVFKRESTRSKRTAILQSSIFGKQEEAKGEAPVTINSKIPTSKVYDFKATAGLPKTNAPMVLKALLQKK